MINIVLTVMCFRVMLIGLLRCLLVICESETDSTADIIVLFVWIKVLKKIGFKMSDILVYNMMVTAGDTINKNINKYMLKKDSSQTIQTSLKSSFLPFYDIICMYIWCCQVKEVEVVSFMKKTLAEKTTRKGFMLFMYVKISSSNK